MATGNNIEQVLLKTDASLTTETAQNAHLVMALGKQSLSLLLSNAAKDQVLMLGHYRWDDNRLTGQALIDRYDAVIDQLPFRIDRSASALNIIDQDGLSLVPESLYQKGAGELLLSYTKKLKEGEQVFSDHWANSEVMALHSLEKSLADWHESHFSMGPFIHQATALFKLQKNFQQEGYFAMLHVGTQTADFLIAREQKVLFYNKFQGTAPEDLSYHLLFALEQNRILATELRLYLSGHCLKGDKVFETLERYIGSVEELPLPSNLQLSKEISPREFRQYIHLAGGL